MAMTSRASATCRRQLGLVWEHLLPGLSDGPLPEDGEGRRLLIERLEGLRLDPPHGAPTSPAGPGSAGGTITFEPNTLGIRNAVLETADGHDRLTVDHGEETVIVSVGHDAPVVTRTTLRRQDPEDVLVSGSWTSPDTYVLTCRFVESPFVVTATATVDGDDVVVEGGVQRRLRSGRLPAARGQRPGDRGRVGGLTSVSAARAPSTSR